MGRSDQAVVCVTKRKCWTSASLPRLQLADAGDRGRCHEYCQRSSPPALEKKTAELLKAKRIRTCGHRSASGPPRKFETEAAETGLTAGRFKRSRTEAQK